MRLVIDDLADLELRACRTRPIGGYRACQMSHDFSIEGLDSITGHDIAGKAGEWVVVHPDDDETLTIVADAEFKATYALAQAPRTKPARTDT